MFVYDPEYTFEWPVKVPLPGGEVQEFTAVFRTPADEQEIFEKITGGDTSELVAAARDRLRRYWVGYGGIMVAGGGELAWSEEARDRLLALRHVRLAVDNALFEALIGVREKN